MGMKGQEIVAGELSPEISPTWTLEDNAIEWGFLKDVRYCSVGVYQASGAPISNCRLRNIAGSGVLVVIDEIWVTPEGNTGIVLRLGPTVDQTVLANVHAAGAVDSRWGFQEPSLQISSGNTAVTGSYAMMREYATGRARTEYNKQIVMVPGTHLDIGTTSAEYCLFNILWHERALTPLESDKPLR